MANLVQQIEELERMFAAIPPPRTQDEARAFIAHARDSVQKALALQRGRIGFERAEFQLQEHIAALDDWERSLELEGGTN